MQKMHKINKKNNFTLVELMVTIVIIGVIMAIIVPAFRKLSTGNVVDASARMLSAQIRLARSEAVSRRKRVAIIMPGHDYKSKTDDDNIYNFQSFRAAIVDNNNNFENWVEGTEWVFIPVGAVIASVNEKDEGLKDESGKKIPDDTWNSTEDSSKFFKEKFEVVIDQDDEDGNYMNGGSTSNNSVRAVIFTPNGRSTKKLYITVMEGVYTSVEYQKYKNSSFAQPQFPERLVSTNLRVMEINAFTGQLRYIF